jgi:phage terminase Nu1 subunit (DNA packaging protein)
MTHAEGDERLFRTRDVAALAGVDPSTVAHWTRDGILPVHSRTVGGHARYRKAQVMHALAEVQRQRYRDELEDPTHGRQLLPAADPVTDPTLTTDLLGGTP